MSEGTNAKDRAGRLPPGLTPRLLTRDEAAAYCGIGGDLFERCVQVAPMRFGNRKRWDVRAIDRWLDQRMVGDDPLSFDQFGAKGRETTLGGGIAKELRNMLDRL